MKFLLCLALCFVAAQAGLIGVPSAVTYSASAPYTTYTAGIAPALYNAPLAYTSGYPSGYPSVYSSGLAAPAVYSSSGLGLVSSAYAAAPAVYSSPSVYSTLLKK
ncbi:uncharacterized protein LOC129948079 [Eupeodes corollae]|uniref:uncharacterized protein LOC129948079 n=1 Tax=Eupeodes corollae TaxID=290404 RepID=UPI00249141C1|nr:uncharacterized protein LOC129948079 [Eupeodes corollae]